MNLYIPDNIFAAIFASALPSDSKLVVVKKESALLCKQLETDTSAIALVPSLELIKHQTLFISSKFGISFDGILSNSYLYFQERKKSVEKLKVRGDASINEIVLAKIIFEEHFASKIEISLDTSKEKNIAGDYLIIGSENFKNRNYEKGISFSDEIAEMLDFPYVNYLFVSQDKESIEYINSLNTDIDERIENGIKNILVGLNYPEEVNDFISENLGSVYFEMTGNELEAVRELFKLVYYRGIVDDIFDLKFV